MSKKGISKWNEEKIIEELKIIIKEIYHFPTFKELVSLNRSDLIHAIQRNGGLNKFRQLFGYEILHRHNGYWNDKIIIEELTKIKNEIGHFPTGKELINSQQYDLVNAIHRNGGILKFRKLLGDSPLRVSKGYWTEETIIQELKEIKDKIGHFPTQIELANLGHSDLSTAISKHGGLNKFRILFRYEPFHKPKDYWSDETILQDLAKIKENIGHFPTQNELKIMGRSDLVTAIAQNGGINKFRILMGYDYKKKPTGYWSDEIVIRELKKTIDKLGHFPTYPELIDIGQSDLATQISVHGGINKFRELCGESLSFYQKYRSELASYTNKRGKSTERVVKSILQNWCKQNQKIELMYNTNLSKGHIIEFVCNTNKTIGIDVTNTETKYAISRKYSHKSYHKYLDELWIVVFSDTFNDSDYNKWKQKSPKNVKVMSVYTFLEELDYSLDSQTKSKIDRYCSCTFHTKEELQNNIQ